MHKFKAAILEKLNSPLAIKEIYCEGPSLGQVFVEECWTEGHPAYGDIVCGEHDANPQYIQDPEGLKHEMYLCAFVFIFLFVIHRLNEEENFW